MKKLLLVLLAVGFASIVRADSATATDAAKPATAETTATAAAPAPEAPKFTPEQEKLLKEIQEKYAKQIESLKIPEVLEKLQADLQALVNLAENRPVFEALMAQYGQDVEDKDGNKKRVLGFDDVLRIRFMLV